MTFRQCPRAIRTPIAIPTQQVEPSEDQVGPVQYACTLFEVQIDQNGRRGIPVIAAAPETHQRTYNFVKIVQFHVFRTDRRHLQHRRDGRLGDGQLGYVHLVHAVGHTVTLQSGHVVSEKRILVRRYEIVEEL